MAKITQLTVTAQSKPGVLAKVCDALSRAGVNIPPCAHRRRRDAAASAWW
jgi:ACT domain-containing protein